MSLLFPSRLGAACVLLWFSICVNVRSAAREPPTEDLIAGAETKTLTLSGSAAGAGEIAGTIGATSNTTALNYIKNLL